jgi:hypothetical protein
VREECRVLLEAEAGANQFLDRPRFVEEVRFQSVNIPREKDLTVWMWR